MTNARVVRLAEKSRASVSFTLDGGQAMAMQGDTVLTAVLANAPALSESECGPEARAGFCLMGACQDCWMWQEAGPRLRACSTLIAQGMQLRTQPPEDWP
jgi:predicted molibdopterin-dependent oxidoreductase YjgC